MVVISIQFVEIAILFIEQTKSEYNWSFKKSVKP